MADLYERIEGYRQEFIDHYNANPYRYRDYDRDQLAKAEANFIQSKRKGDPEYDEFLRGVERSSNKILACVLLAAIGIPIVGALLAKAFS